MILKVIIDDQLYELNVPEAFNRQAADFYAQLDRDMDQGWQMSREWVDHPTLHQRCQIVGDKLLTALEKENHKLGRLMAGYILTRLPQIESIELDVSGEMQNIILLKETPEPASAAVQAQPAAPSAPAAGGMDKMAALEQAGQDVTKVFKVGRHWRFSMYDHQAGQWRDSPTVADEAEAEHLRQEAFKARYEELVGKGGRA